MAHFKIILGFDHELLADEIQRELNKTIPIATKDGLEVEITREDNEIIFRVEVPKDEIDYYVESVRELIVDMCAEE